MERKRVTCPETGHLEEIAFEQTTAGIVIVGCSRFEPACALQCPRECARRMDRHDRMTIDGGPERVLVAYASHDGGRTKLIAEVLSDHLVRDGLVVELADLDTPPPPEDYDAVVVGTSVQFGQHSRAAVAYVEEHRDTLVHMAAFLFTVNDASVTPAASDPSSDVNRWVRKTRWQPTDSATFCAPACTDRLVTLPRILASLLRRRPVATQWTQVHDFALRIADQVPAASERSSLP